MAETKQEYGNICSAFPWICVLPWGSGCFPPLHPPRSPPGTANPPDTVGKKPSQPQSPLLCRTHKSFLGKTCLRPDPVNDLTALEHSLRFWIPGSIRGLQAGSSSWKGMQGSAVVRLKRSLPVHEPYPNREEEDWIYVLPKKLYTDFLQFCVYKMSARQKIWSLAG